MAAATTVSHAVERELPPPPPPSRPRVMLVGTAMAAGGCVMLIAGMLGIYLAQRHQVIAGGKKWLPSGAIPLTPANMALITLLLSVVTMHWALYAARNEDRRNTWVALGVSIMFGAAFINASVFIYTQMHLGVAKSLPALLIYTTTGAHVAMVAAAMLFALLAAFRTFGDERVGREREEVAAAVLFWDVSVVLFAVIWYAIYVTK